MMVIEWLAGIVIEVSYLRFAHQHPMLLQSAAEGGGILAQRLLWLQAKKDTYHSHFGLVHKIGGPGSCHTLRKALVAKVRWPVRYLLSWYGSGRMVTAGMMTS